MSEEKDEKVTVEQEDEQKRSSSDEQKTSKRASSSMTEILPGIKMTDPRPTDLEIFFRIMPHILGGWAGKTTDVRSANSSAFIQAREALGQMAMMGVVRASFVCNDRSHLAVMPTGGHPQMQQQPQQQGMAQGQPMTSPGSGGMTQQYPTNGYGPGVQPPPQSSQAGQGGQVGIGGMVQMFPMHQAAPTVHGAPNFGDGSKGVLTNMYPTPGAVPVPPMGPPPPPQQPFAQGQAAPYSGFAAPPQYPSPPQYPPQGFS
jgi:hypothetical protein